MSLKFKIMLDRYLGGLLIFLLDLIAPLLGRFLKRDHSLPVRGDILVIKMLGGGSLVMAFPALLGIRRTYPQAKIRLFTTPAVKPFAESLGLFDEIFVFDDVSLSRLFISSFKSIFACLGTDTIIDLEIYSYLSTVISLLVFARNRIGFFYEETGFRQRLHTHRVFFNPASPLYLHYDRVAQIMGAPVAAPEQCTAYFRAAFGGAAEKTLKATKRIAIGCGCSDLSNERKLQPEQWSRHVFGTTADKNAEVFFIGAQSDWAEAARVIQAVKDGNQDWGGTFYNKCGALSLQDSLSLLESCDEFWGIESSLLHYARMMGLRCRTYLGPTHPSRLRPIPGLEEKIFYRKTACSPCIHLVSIPPCHGDNLCMKWLFDDAADQANSQWMPVVTNFYPGQPGAENLGHKPVGFV